MDTASPSPATTGSVTSRDGTRIGYRRMGSGPGLVLLHGGLQSSASFTRLGAILANQFTVYIPDRRGRGFSGPNGDSYSLASEVEDLAALLEASGTRQVFALSSGALVTLQAALTLPGLDRIALYEPPLHIDGRPSPMAWVPRYDRAMAESDLATALAAIIKGTGDRSLFTSLPRFLLVAMFRQGLRNRPSQPTGDDGPPLQALIPTMHFDTLLIREMAGRVKDFSAVRTPTLLMGGSRSAAFLPAALDALETVLPNARRMEFAGLGHIAADNTGQPARVAEELRRYFS